MHAKRKSSQVSVYCTCAQSDFHLFIKNIITMWMNFICSHLLMHPLEINGLFLLCGCFHFVI